jgi:TRAP-type C4-dicarboxylate transport system permease small subunit
MRLRNVGLFLIRIVTTITNMVSWIAYVAFAAMIIYIVADICGRQFFNQPLPSNVELIYVALLSVGGFTMMWATVKKAHIKVDIVFTRLPMRVQMIMDSIYYFIALAIWSIFTYFVIKQSLISFKIHESSVDLLLPVGIFSMILGISLIMFCISLLVCIFEPWLTQGQAEDNPTGEEQQV